MLGAYHREMGQHIISTIEKRTYRSASDAVEDALRECGAWVLGDPRMGRLLIRIMFGSDLLMQSDDENSLRLNEWMRAQLEGARKKGEIRRSLDIPLFQSLLMGALSSTVIEWNVGDAAFDLEGQLVRKVRFLFRAAQP